MDINEWIRSKATRRTLGQTPPQPAKTAVSKDNPPPGNAGAGGTYDGPIGTWRQRLQSYTPRTIAGTITKRIFGLPPKEGK